MTQKPESFNPFDPTGVFKEMRDNGMDAWAKSMTQLVNTDAYAKSTGAMLDAWLSSSAPFQKAIQSAMTQTLAQWKLPCADDLHRLGERLTNIEMRLDDMEAKIDTVLKK
ncbi:MAG: hypothetical protein R3E01_26725 [Pirellulaceae bacterium]|nr:hypothetical protein [Planctomycetales bacterium]